MSAEHSSDSQSQTPDSASGSGSRSGRELRAGDDVFVRRRAGSDGHSTLNLDAAKSVYGGMAGAHRSKRDMEAVVKAKKEALLRDLRPKHAIMAQSVDRAKEAVLNKYKSKHQILRQGARPVETARSSRDTSLWQRLFKKKDDGRSSEGSTSEEVLSSTHSDGSAKSSSKKKKKKKSREERDRELEARKLALLDPNKLEPIPADELTSKEMDAADKQAADELAAEQQRNELELTEIDRDTAPLLTLEEAAQLISQPTAMSILGEVGPRYNPYDDLQDIVKRQKYYFNQEHLRVFTASNMGTLMPSGPSIYKDHAFQERIRSDIQFNPEVSVRRYNPHNKQDKPKEVKKSQNGIEPLVDKGVEGAEAYDH